MSDFRTKGSPGRRVDALRLPGDFERRSAQERRELRERWARGEGLESPAFRRLQDEVVAESQPAHQPRYRKSRGAGALEDALAKLPPLEPLSWEALRGRGETGAGADAPEAATGRVREPRSLKEGIVAERKLPESDVSHAERDTAISASQTEWQDQAEELHIVDEVPGVRAPKFSFGLTQAAQAEPGSEEVPQDAALPHSEPQASETSYSDSDDSDSTAGFDSDAESLQKVSDNENVVDASVDVGVEAPSESDASSLDAAGEQPGLPDDSGSWTGGEPDDSSADDLIDSFSAYDDRYAHYYDDYDYSDDQEQGPNHHVLENEDPYGHYDPYQDHDPYREYDPYENHDPYGNYDPYQNVDVTHDQSSSGTSDEGEAYDAVDGATGQERSPEDLSEAPQEFAATTSGDAASEVSDVSESRQSDEERGPVIRRVASSIDKDGYVIPELKEASNVYLTLLASEDAPVSRVDFSTPVTEAAVSLVTSRQPRVTDEMISEFQAQEALGAAGEATAEGATVPAPEAAASPQKRSRMERLRNVDHLTASTLVLMIGNVLSKLTGQLRQVLYPHVFVEKYLTDAYVQGFLIPDFIYELLIGGSIQAAIVPTLAEALGTDEEQKVWKSISKFISFVSLVMLGFLLLAEWLTPQILRPFVKPENIELTSRMARALFPQTFFMMCAAMVIGLINAHRKFLKTTFGPAIYNTLFVLSIFIFGAPNEDALVHVGLGVSFSALVYFLFQFTMGREEVRPFKFGIDLKDKGFQHLLILVVPILFSSSISHINTMVLHGFTKNLEAGAATALNQTNSVWLLPYGIFSVAIGQAMLPTLSSLIGRKQEKGAADVLSMSLRRMLYFAIPSALSFYLLRGDLMQGIYIWRFEGYSEQIEVTRLAAELLRFYCLSILFQSIIYIYNYAFYAMKITYLPLINGVISLVLTLVVGSYTTRPEVLGAAGLSVSYALSGFVTALMLIILYRLRFPKLAPRFFSRDWGIFFLKLIPMIVISCAALLAMERYIVLDLTARKLPQLLWLGARFVVVFGLWYLLSKLLRLDLGTKKGKEAVAAIR